MISNNGIITLMRGDSFTTSICINLGSKLSPNIYKLKEGDSLYFGLMEPNQAFEDAILKKKFDFTSPTDEEGNTLLKIYPEDTLQLLVGKYYYMIKLKQPGPDEKDIVTTIIPPTQFFLDGGNETQDTCSGSPEYEPETVITIIDTEIEKHNTSDTAHNDIRLSIKELSSQIPTKTSELTNDSGFLTEHQSLAGYATESWVEAKNYLTKHQSLDGYATEQWVESKGYLTQHQDISGKVDKEPGKTLTSNDFTDEDKVKLDNIEYGAEVNAVNDILIKNTSLVTDGIANIPLGSTGVLGVFQTGTNLGIVSNDDGQLYLDNAVNSEITARSSYRKPIVTKNFDYAVKVAMCDGKGEAWTDTEQKAARTRMGVDVIENKLDVLWKLNEGISYDFVTDSTEGYTKTIPSGGKYAAVESIGGKTVVWNQLVNHDIIAPTPVTSNGVVWSYNSDGSYTLTGTITGTYSTLNVIQNSFSNVGCLIVGHKYLYNLSSKNITATSTNGIFTISEIGDNPRIYMQISGRTTGDEINEKITPRFIDLTLMFGEGNEPTSTNDERIKWIEPYAKAHPEYNTGELVSADVCDVAEQGKNLIPFPYRDLKLGTTTVNGIDFTVYEDGSILINGTATKSTTKYLYNNITDLLGLKSGITISGSKNASDDTQQANVYLICNYYDSAGSMKQGLVASTTSSETKTITNDWQGLGIYINIPSGKTLNNLLIKPQLEIGTKATDYSPYHSNIYTIPTNVRSLTGYGWSAGSVYNGIERTENGWQYVQRVDRIDMADISYTRTLITNNYWFYSSLSGLMSLPKLVGFCINAKYGLSKHNIYFNYTDKSYFIGNTQQAPVIYIRDDSYTDADTFKTAMQGVILYYELAEPIITDITDLMIDFPKNFEVEAGGTITFNNTVELPVLNTVKYLRALAEVEVSV